ncbi:MAG: bifunctional oligoribonuclease/PAP phosphatase NrnA, partial [Gemmatimonadetes bacterium]|nr:bifunctional oligoribonuclease/PAP phosphatase NrnA [Gemmatimonadota bacterium]
MPPARAAQLGAVLERLLDARRVVLSTHINADGDAAGSTAAAAAWLEARGIQATI